MHIDNISHSSAHSCEGQATSRCGRRSREGNLFLWQPKTDFGVKGILLPTVLAGSKLIILNLLRVQRTERAEQRVIFDKSASNKITVYLESAIQSSWNCDTFSRLSTSSCDGCYQTIQLISLLLQLLYQTLNSSLTERLALPSLAKIFMVVSACIKIFVAKYLPMTHETVDD